MAAAAEASKLPGVPALWAMLRGLLQIAEQQYTAAERTLSQAVILEGDRRLSEEGPRYSCGNRGCLEVMASTSAVLRRVRQGIFDENILSTLRSLEFVEKLGRGDPGCPYLMVSLGPLTRYVGARPRVGVFFDKLLR